MKKTILSLTLLLAVGLMATKVNAQVSVGLSVRIAPPAIPVYVQPPCPVDGYIWIPGYWAWDDDAGDYYWVPGYWSAPPAVGLLWTPGYWGWVGGVYRWNAGYWGPHVGYYGGINYGCGYGGTGYYGGEWYGGRFRYNTAVTRVNTTVIHNTYVNRTVIHNVNANRVSYNGGPGGVNYRPNVREQAAMNDRHIERTNVQAQHQQAAMHDRASFASLNHGRPGTPAVARPVSYSRPGAAPSRPAVSRPNPASVNRSAAAPRPQVSRPPMHNAPAARPVQPQMNRPQPHPAQQRPMPQARPAQPHPTPQSHPVQPRPMPQRRPGGPPDGGGGGEHHHR